MGTLRERQRLHRDEAAAARQRLDSGLPLNPAHMMPADKEQTYREAIKARWRGGPTVISFLFAHPDSDAIRMLDARGGYFDQRTGDTWDLFFPGYYRSMAYYLEDQVNAQRVGLTYAHDWFFSPADFNLLREHVEQSSERRWEYSGGTDLVLVNGWLTESEEPVIDWASTISGRITDRADATETLTLANVIETITRDLETGAEDSSYGVGQLTAVPRTQESHVVRDIMVNALGGIAAAFGLRVFGL